MGFIPIDKMQALREAAKNGDERAKKIIKCHLMKEDYSKDLDDYFRPSVDKIEEKETISEPVINSASENKGLDFVENSKLRQFLLANGITEKGEEYDNAVSDYYNEFPKEREEAEEKVPSYEPDPEVDYTSGISLSVMNAIEESDKLLKTIYQNDEISETAKKGSMVLLQEIKQNLFDIGDKIKKIKHSVIEKENNI